MSAVLKARLILKSKTTPASVHDSQVFKELLDQKDQAVLADSACHRTEREAHLIKLIEQEFLMRKATRGYPFSEAEQQTNHTISGMRVRVVGIFARLTHIGADWCRSIGLKRATEHNHVSNLVYNMDLYACRVGVKSRPRAEKPREDRKIKHEGNHTSKKQTSKGSIGQVKRQTAKSPSFLPSKTMFRKLHLSICARR